MQHPHNTCHLKELHQEIDLLDRKVAHCQNLEKYDTEQERTAAVTKLSNKRALLVKAANELAEAGVVVDPKYLARSFRNAESTAKVEA